MIKKYDCINPGKVWLDTEGNRIQAHGGSMLYVGNKFYWYGENKENTVSGNGIWHNGVNLYSSDDFYNWKKVGTILFPETDEKSPLHPNKIVDRPHIIYNEKDKRFVMWIKLAGSNDDRDDWQCQYMCVAVSDNIEKPFKVVKYFHPLGFNSGDFDLVVDQKNKKAYIYFEQVHFNLVCAELTPDYLDVTGNYSVNMQFGAPPFVREAPAFFEKNNKKYLLTSGTTGYFSNPSNIAVCDNYFGVWESLGDPCIDDKDKNSFSAQFSSVFKHPDKENLYIALGDRWLTDLPEDMPNLWDSVLNGVHFTEFNKYSSFNTSKADYVWLPITFENGKPVIRWRDNWKIEDFD